MQHTYGFMGWVFQYLLEGEERLSLYCFRDKFNPGFLRYIAFLKARGCSGDYMCKTCHSAVRVLHYLKSSSSPPYTSLQQQQFKEELEVLDILKWQLRKIQHHTPFNYEALLEKSNWKGGAPEIIAFIEQEKEKACTLVKVSISGGCRWAGAGCAAHVLPVCQVLGGSAV